MLGMLVKASSQQKIIASSKKNIYKDLRQKEKKGTKKMYKKSKEEIKSFGHFN